jgi:hypothetical protein
METPENSPAFVDALKKAIAQTPKDKLHELPLGVLVLERDGKMASFHVQEALTEDGDLGSALMALDFILYSFDREDWMIEFVQDLDRNFDRHMRKKRRETFKVIEGGKSEDDAEPPEDPETKANEEAE